MTTTPNIGRMGDLVSTIGSPRFSAEYFRLFNDALAATHCTVFAFRQGEKPAALVTECTGQDVLVRRLAHEYVAGGFTKDPNIRRSINPSTQMIYTLRAQDVGDADYRRHFYEQPSLSHELVLLGNVNGTLFYSSFYRNSGENQFQRNDLDALSLLAEFAIKVLQRHVELQPWQAGGFDFATPRADFEASAPFGTRHEGFVHLRNVFLNDPANLSPREADICAAIVLGYSAPAISLNLGISPNTVATHRKHAYRKLGICSQTELFGLYFKNAAHLSGRTAAGLRPSAA